MTITRHDPAPDSRSPRRPNEKALGPGAEDLEWHRGKNFQDWLLTPRRLLKRINRAPSAHAQSAFLVHEPSRHRVPEQMRVHSLLDSRLFRSLLHDLLDPSHRVVPAALAIPRATSSICSSSLARPTLMRMLL